MNADFQIYRTESEMKQGLQKIRQLRQRFQRVRIDDKSRIFNTALQEAYELGFMLDLAECIAAGALTRQESRGGHYRRDFEKRDDVNFLQHTLAYQSDVAGQPELRYKPVVITEFQPKERKY